MGPRQGPVCVGPRNVVGMGIAVCLLFGTFYPWASTELALLSFSLQSFISNFPQRLSQSDLVLQEHSRWKKQVEYFDQFWWLLVTYGLSLLLLEAHGPVTTSPSWWGPDKAFGCQDWDPELLHTWD